MSVPVAVASIALSEEQRTRIAAELGLGPDELDAVPTKLDIARYEVADEAGDEVGGFAAGPVVGSAPLASLSLGSILTTPKVGRVPGSILMIG